MPPTDLQTDIASNAQGPAEARGDQGSMRQHPLRDQIAADRYLAAKNAIGGDRSKKTIGIRMVQFVAAGSI